MSKLRGSCDGNYVHSGMYREHTTKLGDMLSAWSLAAVKAARKVAKGG